MGLGGGHRFAGGRESRWQMGTGRASAEPCVWAACCHSTLPTAPAMYLGAGTAPPQPLNCSRLFPAHLPLPDPLPFPLPQPLPSTALRAHPSCLPRSSLSPPPSSQALRTWHLCWESIPIAWQCRLCSHSWARNSLAAETQIPRHGHCAAPPGHTQVPWTSMILAPRTQALRNPSLQISPETGVPSTCSSHVCLTPQRMGGHGELATSCVAPLSLCRIMMFKKERQLLPPNFHLQSRGFPPRTPRNSVGHDSRVSAHALHHTAPHPVHPENALWCAAQTLRSPGTYSACPP